MEMKTKEKYWHIVCEKHTKVIFEKKINSKYISEKDLEHFIRVLLSKYALTDEEIFEQYISKPFEKKKNYIDIFRTNSNNFLEINFLAQIADISVHVNLTD